MEAELRRCCTAAEAAADASAAVSCRMSRVGDTALIPAAGRYARTRRCGAGFTPPAPAPASAPAAESRGCADGELAAEGVVVEEVVLLLPAALALDVVVVLGLSSGCTEPGDSRE